MNFVSNIIWNSVEGFVEAGTRTAGGYAGDALLKAGDLIEGSGRNIGNGIERTASSYGNKLSSGAPAPSTVARKPAVRSHSVPASSKPRAPTSKTPVGVNKYPGGKPSPSAAKQITSGAKSTVGAATKALPKPYPNNVPYGTKNTPSSTAAKSTPTKNTSLPKPYPGSSFPTHNNTPAKKTAVRPGGAPKPFNAAAATKSLPSVGKPDVKPDVKPYPGTNTLPGQSRTPVRPQKYKPLERMKPPVEAGKMNNFFV